jgi:hypothetical protein
MTADPVSGAQSSGERPLRRTQQIIRLGQLTSSVFPE